MKKLTILTIAASLLAGTAATTTMTSCNSKQKEQLEQERAIAEATKEELQTAVAERDQLLQLVNEISGGMAEIKRIENILTVKNGLNEEGSDSRTQLQADLAAVQKTLQDRRERLEALESQLAKSSLSTSGLQQTIASLRRQIDDQTAEIGTLRQNLAEARQRIGDLDTQLDSLNTAVTEATAAKEQIEHHSTELENQLNTCYYAIGNKSELQEHKIIETGFLRKTKLLESDFDPKFFTAADKRTLTRIDLNSDKAELMTKQPEDSYVIEEVGKSKVLRITNPDKFWNLSNYLVIKID